MAVDPDPRAHISSTTDFYALLDLPATFSTPDELRRAYRKGSRKYHPDKAVRPDASDADKERAREQWDLFEVAVKLLEDASLRSQYDNARTAREQRKQRDAKNDAIRQAMVDRLEKRESGAALKRSAEEMDAEAEEREVRRLEGEGARAREALAKKRRAMEKDIHGDSEEVGTGGGAAPATPRSMSPEKEVLRAFPTRKQDEGPLPPEERTIKVRWPAETKIDVSRLESVFSRFGAIDSVVLGQTKNERLGDSRDKKPVGRGFIQFKGKIGVYDAVYEWREERDNGDSNDWKGIEDVTWLTKSPPAWAEKEGDNRSRSSTPKPATPAATTPLRSSRNPRDFLNSPLGSVAGTPVTNGKLRTVPSFGSFKSSIGKK